MNITLIGSGNVAGHLAPALENAGHRIIAVYSRNRADAEILSASLHGTQPTDSLNFAGNSSDIFILAVRDDAIREVVTQLSLPENTILVHTSGTQSMEVLRRFPDVGVFYPLQTFSSGKPLEMSRVPFCLEASNSATERVLVGLARSLSRSVQVISSAERKVLHLGAVLACNFTNHLLALSSDILRENQLPFDLLKPLIEETVAKALAAEHPAAVQTGPAVRNDTTTIREHLGLLRDRPELANLYQLLSQSIIRLRRNRQQNQ